MKESLQTSKHQEKPAKKAKPGAPEKPHEPKKRQKFSGKIEFISYSPHGDPEGIVLKDGVFIRIPPHSLLDANAFKVGAEISGEGELAAESVAPVYHHAKVMSGRTLVADDSGTKEERESLKTQHKRDLEGRRKSEPKMEDMEISGKVVALGRSPKGEIDRVILEDGTSIHISKEAKLGPKERKGLKVGSQIEVEGEGRAFGKTRFIKADHLKLH